MAEVAGDEEVAEQMLREGHATPPASPPLTDFDPTVRALADLYDRVGTLISVVHATTGKKSPPIPPFQRPRTALQRLRERRRWTKHRDLVSRLLPGR